MSILIPSLRGAIAVPGWAKNELWRKARAIPSLDQRFAESRSLVDAVSGQNLITFTRASSGTYVDSDGLIKTAGTDEPRFDHDPVTGECLGLLVEGSRTNLLLWSEKFDQPAWGKGSPATVTVSTESITSPAEDVIVQKVKETATTGVHFVNQAPALAASTVYTLSFFAKSAERTLIDVIVGQGTAYTARGFNLSTGVSAANVSSLPDAGTVNSSIIAYPNGWYRVSVTMTSTQADTTGTAQIRLRDGNSISYTGDGTSGVYLWGAQLE